MVDFYDFEITLKLKGKGEMNRAEDWIAENIRGLWALEFIGMQEEVDGETGLRQHLLVVRFKFGRQEDYLRFKNEYIEGKAPVRKPAPGKSATPPKKKGVLGWLLD